MIYPDCYFAQFADDDCFGEMDPCHILRQQDLKKEWGIANPRIPTAWIAATALTGTDLEELLADRRNIVGGCRRHHDAADHGPLTYEIPASVYDFADDLGLLHYLPVREVAA